MVASPLVVTMSIICNKTRVLLAHQQLQTCKGNTLNKVVLEINQDAIPQGRPVVATEIFFKVLGTFVDTETLSRF